MKLRTDKELLHEQEDCDFTGLISKSVAVAVLYRRNCTDIFCVGTILLERPGLKYYLLSKVLVFI